MWDNLNYMINIIIIILITIGVIIGLVIIFLAVLFIRMILDKNKMNPLKTQEVIQGIFALKDDYVNFFLIKGKDNYIAVDAGMNKDRITAELNKLNIDPNTISTVFLTHSDFDHIGGVDLFKNAKVYLPEEEKQLVNGETHRFFIFYDNKLDCDYELIRDGQAINVEGLSIRSIATPGHTPGSVCYLIDSKYLFTGDNLSLKQGKVAIFSDVFNMDSKIQKESISRLKELEGVTYIFSGHHGFSTNYSKAFEDFK